MWMMRPDLHGGDGWQILDGTPQELSDGKFQCGPAPRNFVRDGKCGNYDTDFVFSEISIPVRTYITERDGQVRLNSIDYTALGVDIRTKNIEDSKVLNLTKKYKCTPDF